MVDKSPFFLRPYHVKEEDHQNLDREMKRLHYLGILKEGFFTIFMPSNAYEQKINPG